MIIFRIRLKHWLDMIEMTFIVNKKEYSNDGSHIYGDYLKDRDKMSIDKLENECNLLFV